MTSDKKHIAKWGFGSAPISSRMRKRYDDAVQHLTDILMGNLSLQEAEPDLISEAKGMANRCILQDQWDWFSVFSEFGAPPIWNLKLIVKELIPLRKAVINEDENSYSRCIKKLVNSNFLHLLDTYQNGLQNQFDSKDAGWIYVLSTREARTTLKIGRTDRSVIERVREINAATGVVIPWSARRVYRVRDTKKIEKAIHENLGQYRIREDREFFELEISKADEVIRECIKKLDAKYFCKGNIVWFDRVRGFGFISLDNHPNIFIHKSQISSADMSFMKEGAEITFLIGKNPNGLCAINAKIVKSKSSPITKTKPF